MDDIWKVLSGRNGLGDEKPIDIWFDKFPNFFKQRSDRSFTNRLDILEEDRPKIIHN